MASSSGRYQSKLFNLLSRSFQQLAKLQPHLRQVQVKAVWGVQLLFHVASGLIQTGFRQKQKSRRLVADLDQEKGAIAPTKGQSDLTIFSERSIQRTLQVVECLLFDEIEATETSIQRSRPAVQGIATQLRTRTLVLVAPGNEVLDLLTPQQQQQLHRQIAWQIFRYGVSARLTQAARLLKQQRPALISSVRSALSLGRWQVRQRLQLSPTFLGRSPLLKASYPDRLDSAGVESVQPSWAASVLRPVKVALVGRSFHATLSFLQGKISWPQSKLGEQPVPTPDPVVPADELTIRALIRAALIYFFGRNSWKIGSQPNSDQLGSSLAESQPQHQQLSEPKTPTSKPPLASGTEPWLTWADLFGRNSALESTPTAQKTSNSRAKSTKEVSLSQTLSQPTPPVVNQDSIDIEIEAILLGYTKHPLEQLLDWLDHTIAWLEKILAKLEAYLQTLVTTLVRLIQRHKLP